MAHDTHQEHHTSEPENVKVGTSYRSAFWFTIILAGLFIAAVNFVNVMSHDDEGGHDAGHGTEQHAAPGEGHGSEAPQGHSDEGASDVGGHATEPAVDSAHAGH